MFDDRGSPGPVVPDIVEEHPSQDRRSDQECGGAISRVMEQVNSHNPDAVFVDGTGIGWGVHDRLNQLGCPNLVGVDFGAKADRTDASDAAAR